MRVRDNVCGLSVKEWSFVMIGGPGVEGFGGGRMEGKKKNDLGRNSRRRKRYMYVVATRRVE